MKNKVLLCAPHAIFLFILGICVTLALTRMSAISWAFAAGALICAFAAQGVLRYAFAEDSLRKTAANAGIWTGFLLAEMAVLAAVFGLLSLAMAGIVGGAEARIQTAVNIAIGVCTLLVLPILTLAPRRALSDASILQAFKGSVLQGWIPYAKRLALTVVGLGMLLAVQLIGSWLVNAAAFGVVGTAYCWTIWAGWWCAPPHGASVAVQETGAEENEVIPA